MADTIVLEDMAQSLAKQTRAYLVDEMGAKVSGWRKPTIPDGELTLDSLTVTAGVGGSSGLIAAFGFSPELAEHLFRRTVSLMNLSLSQISPMEQELYRQGTLIEAANVIVGHWLPNYPAKNGTAELTPPAILERAKQIRGMSSKQFTVVEVGTQQGDLRITLIRPPSLVEQERNAA
jgi:hypothetical protein